MSYLWQRAICRIKENDGELIMKRFLRHMLQVIFTLVAFASPGILVVLAITCFVAHKIVLGVIFSVASIVCVGIVTYDW